MTASEVRAPRSSKRTGEARRSAASFLAGGTAAGLVRFGLQPLDTCKTRLQAHVSSGTASSARFSARALVSIIVADKGFVGLYRGVVPGIVGIVPAAAVYMLVYQTLKRRASAKIPERRRALRSAAIMASAAIGDTGACAVRVPLEMVKQRLQVGVYSSVAHAIAEISKMRNPRVLYTGMGAQLARDIPFAMTEFLAYETLKEMDLSRRGERDSVPRKFEKQRQLLIGGICGALAAVVSNPMDVVKTRLMTQMPADASNAAISSSGLNGGAKLASQTSTQTFRRVFSRVVSVRKHAPAPALAYGSVQGESLGAIAAAAPRAASRVPVELSGASKVSVLAARQRYQGVVHCFTTILRTEGVGAFAKGLVPRIAAKTLQSALFFATYEALSVLYTRALSVD
eukprot:CAMPEP_0185845540 /NCGR_PEP_ID=MMETSP1354-20130828/1482_1 /TAXON_ID=708628 /ORGANISM="Erythrolobus madagascarensis, Strain CCMP3276" /LENGTH=398 /DNA_ID=CAMNT_0028545527 /DNA_START=139 /DNA_END=1332 /DNA_ORIENTATION=+